MKKNYFEKSLKLASISMLLMLMWANSGLMAQCTNALPQSTTCRFVGEPANSDTLPAVRIGLLPGTCTALVTVPKPALATPGCAQTGMGYTNAGPTTLRNDVGCTFAEACNSSFGCGAITTTVVPGPATPACGPVRLQVNPNGVSQWSDTYILSTGGCALGNFTTGNGVVQNFDIPLCLYNPTGTPITPNKGWGNTTTFGECVPSFTIVTPT